MKEVLSQSEIDLLLNAISSGDLSPVSGPEEELTAKPYDFRRPNKFSKDQLRTLFLIHSNFSRLISNFLSGFLRSRVQVQVASVEQMAYEDFILSVPFPTLITTFSLHPLPGTAILETNPAFTFPIIDLVFGGTGNMAAGVRELTEIERAVFKKLSGKILDNLTYAWADVFEFQPKVEGTETNPQLTQIISPNETVVIVTLTSVIGGTSGIMNICLPYLTLEPLLYKLSAHEWFSVTAKEAQKHKERLEQHLKEVNVQVEAGLGETWVTVREFLQLGRDDIIPLKNNFSGDLEILINGVPKFRGQPGLVGKKIGVQVTGVLKEGESHDAG